MLQRRDAEFVDGRLNSRLARTAYRRCAKATNFTCTVSAFGHLCALIGHVSSFVERKVRFSICYAGIGQFQTREAFGIGLFDCNPHRNSRCTWLRNSLADFRLWNSSQRVLETVLCKFHASVGCSGSWTRRAGLELPRLWIRWKHQRKHRSTSPPTIRCKSHSHLSFLAVNTLRVCLRSLRVYGAN